MANLENKEALVEYEVIDTKIDWLECKINTALEEKEYCKITSALAANNPLDLDLVIKKVNWVPTEYFLAKWIHLLNKPLSAIDFKETLALVNQLWSEKRDIYMDGNQRFRWIYVNDSFGHNNSIIFADTFITGNKNEWNIQEYPEYAAMNNNQTEELFNFITYIRNNPNDYTTERLAGTDLWNPENEDSTQIASLLQNNDSMIATTD